MLENFLLLASRLEGHIETKHSLFLTDILGVDNQDLSPFRLNMDDALVARRLLVSGHGTASHRHLHALVFITHLNLELYAPLNIIACNLYKNSNKVSPRQSSQGFSVHLPEH